MISLACVLLAGAVLVLAFAAVVPSWVERSVAPLLESNAGIEGFEWRVRRIGIAGADFGGIKLGETQPSAIAVASVQIDYDLPGLLNRRLKQVRVSGVDVFFEYANGEVSFPGIDAEKLFAKEAEAGRDSKNGGGPPVFVEKVVFENAMLNGVFENKRFSIPLDLALFSGDENYETVRIVAELFPSGQRIGIDALSEKKSGRLKLAFDAKGFNPAVLAGLSGSDLCLDGSVDMEGKALFGLSPFEFLSAEIRAESENFAGSTGTAKFGKISGNEEPVRFKIEGGGDQWNFSAAGLSVRSGVEVGIETLDGSVRFSENSMEGEFRMTSEVGMPKDGGLSIEPSVRRRWKGRASLVESARWFFEAENGPDDGTESETGSGWHRVVTGDFDARILLPPFVISGKGDLTDGSASAELKIADVHIDAGAFSARLPLLECNAEATDGRILATLKISEGEATFSPYDAAARGFNLELPLAWPPSGRVEAGKASLAGLRLDGRELGKITARIGQDGFGGTVDGAFQSEFVEGLTLQFKGAVEKGRRGLTGRLDFKIDDFRFGPGFSLSGLVPEAEGVLLDGKLALEGGLVKTGLQLESSARIRIDDLKITVEEPSAVVEGVRMDLSMADLLDFRSLSSQRISFDSATSGNIRVNDGSVFFRMESPESIFVEKTSFKWCDGNVETHAVKIDVPFEEVAFTLYCDRLDLAGVLEQLGGIKGEGKGAVNGRIPVRYENSSFKFDDGFLYSTPGEGGTVRLAGTDVLVKGIPADTPQFAQVDLAREALKDYEYEWARINIATKGENLHVNLKLDGQPAGPLPFQYDREFGGFARVEANSPGSNFQGIRLDVNFTLPLDEVLKYGTGLKGLLDNK